MKLKLALIAVTIPILVFSVILGIYWELGQNRGYLFPPIEQIEFQDGSIDLVSVVKADRNFTILLGMKNAGDTAATIESSNILYNGKLSNATEYLGYVPVPDFDVITLKPGQLQNHTITLPRGPESIWQSNMVVQITIETIKGNHFIKVIELP